MDKTRIIRVKGKWGELKTKLALAMLPRSSYRTLNDVRLMWEQGRMAQIDHLVVSKYGIFVVETKDYIGTLTGDDYRKNITQCFFGKTRSRFSPMKQNERHIKALCENLDGHFSVPIHSVICFTSWSKVEITSNKHIITTICQLKSAIKEFDEEVMTQQEMNNLYKFLKTRNRTK